MQTIVVDLTRQPEIADLVADMEPGDTVTLRTSIKSKDDQSLLLTVETATGKARDPDKDVETHGDDDDDEDEQEA